MLTATLLFSPSQSHAISGNEATYTYWLQSGAPTLQKTTYGKWVDQDAPFIGPGTMTKGYNTKTGYSVTGSVTIPVKAVELGLSATFKKEKSLSTTGSREIPNGKKGVFQVRNVYKTYKVKMVEWISIDGRKSKTNSVKYADVKKKVDVEGKIILK